MYDINFKTKYAIGACKVYADARLMLFKRHLDSVSSDMRNKLECQRKKKYNHDGLDLSGVITNEVLSDW